MSIIKKYVVELCDIIFRMLRLFTVATGVYFTISGNIQLSTHFFVLAILLYQK